MFLVDCYLGLVQASLIRWAFSSVTSEWAFSLGLDGLLFVS